MKTAFIAALGLLASLTTVSAAQLEAPAGDVILTVSGNVDNSNGDGVMRFDLDMLKRLSGRTASMETPWTPGQTEFSGPLLAEVLKAAGASGSHMIVKALNDYAAEVPMEDAREFPTILAVEMNGEPMSVRDKGPVFMIYPFDTNPELCNEKYFSRSVWQIREIEVVE